MKTIFLITIKFSLLILTDGGHFTRFKSGFATSLNPQVCTVHYCHIKAYSRRVSTFNIAATLHKTLVKPFYVTKRIFSFGQTWILFIFQIKMIVSYRYGNIFRQILDVPVLEWCDVVNGIKPMFSWKCVSILLRTAPHIFFINVLTKWVIIND